jgi:hypothetical protein
VSRPIDRDAAREPNNAKEIIGMYLLKTGSPIHLRMLRVFEPLMVITAMVTPLATIPPISKL